ncbi:hypothetical protein [Metabacillus idriensis]|uniref:hypothetical protein n=1 Tax=Metabacillus idriensis TaxID=324768 RepID=UPI00163AC253|nr:hypothetical protein [Metabacillus idriensis]QNG59762.1 hypothetical protein H4O14_18625 [Bacillus sp. PAMC26568]
MSKDALKKTVKKIGEQSVPIIATALITGATRVSNEMNDAVSESVSDENQSPKVLLGKIASTLRSGAIAAGKDMMTNGLESIKKNQA